MARTGTTIWLVLGIGAALLLIVALIYGPDLYRKGESIVAPIMELSKSDQALNDLDAELPFTEPADGVVDEARLMTFLEIRRQLLQPYAKYREVENRIERKQQGDFEAAGEVLAVMTEVFDAQIDVLRQHGMSVAEFRWFEFAVYDNWLEEVEQTELSGAALEYASEVREMARGDMDFIDQLQRSHGSSAALAAMRDRLSARLEQIDRPSTPVVEGVPPENGELFWAHRETIAELRLDEYNTVHTRLRQGTSAGVNVTIDSSATDVDTGEDIHSQTD